MLYCDSKNNVSQESMVLKMNTIKNILDLIAEQAKSRDIDKIILFGSRARGDNKPKSDIDIAVIVSHRSENYFEDVPLLWRLGRKINYLIEPVLLTDDDNNPLYSDILKTGILI